MKKAVYVSVMSMKPRWLQSDVVNLESAGSRRREMLDLRRLVHELH